MTERRVPMQVPEKFKRQIRKRAGEKNKSMYALLKEMTENLDEPNESKRKKNQIFKW